MRTCVRVIACLAPLLASAGCASSENDSESFSRQWQTATEESEAVKPLPPGRDLREVVTDARRWSDLWGGLPPEVDFKEEMVLVATVRVVEHPKDMPRIWRLRREDGKPDVSVLVRVRQVGGEFENKIAGKGGYHFVVLPKEEGPFHWKDVRVVYDAGGEVDTLELVKSYDK
ncbi:MAG: hypothetical protein AAB074_12435 [Planctomycetota bacterium]